MKEHKCHVSRFAVPPGDTVMEWLYCNDRKLGELIVFFEEHGIDKVHTLQMLLGRENYPLTEDMAQLLEDFTRDTALVEKHVWLKLEELYQRDLKLYD